MARSVAVKGAACTTGHGCDAVTTVLGGSPNVLIGNLGVLTCLLYTSPSPRDKRQSRMPSSA